MLGLRPGLIDRSLSSTTTAHRSAKLTDINSFQIWVTKTQTMEKSNGFLSTMKPIKSLIFTETN